MNAAEEIQAAIEKMTQLRDDSSFALTYSTDPHLIVTLHETIDAQLAILEAAVGGNHDDPSSVACAFVLAEAINGGTK